VVMALKTRNDLFDLETAIDTRKLYPVSRQLAAVIGSFVPRNKAIIGDNAFAHEAGIHQHGMLAHRETYEIMRPEDVGISRSTLVLGKHSGRHALADRVRELGFSVSDTELLDAVNTSLAAESLAGTDADTTAKAQAIVDDYAAVLGAAKAGSVPGVDATDYATIGITGVDADGVALLNSVVPGKDVADLDAHAELQTLADQAQSVIARANGAEPAPTLTKADLEALGIENVTDDNRPAIIAAIDNSAAAAVNTQSALQGVVDKAITDYGNALDKIKAYARDASQTKPNTADFADIGMDLGGFDAERIAKAVNSVLATDDVGPSGSGAQTNVQDVDTAADVQAVASGYAKVFTAADATFNFNAGAVDNTQLNHLGFPSLTSERLAFLQTSLDLLGYEDVATHNDLQSVIDLVEDVFKVAEQGAGAEHGLDPAAFAILGVRNVNEDNIDELIEKVGSTFDDPDNPDENTDKSAPTMAGVQSIVNAIAALDEGRQALVDAAQGQDGSETAVPVRASNFLSAGIQGITSDDAKTLNAVFAEQPSDSKNSFTEVEALTETYASARDSLKALANSTAGSDRVTMDEFAALAMGQLDTAVSVALTNDLLDTLDFVEVARTRANQQAIADLAVALETSAVSGEPAAQITREGLEHVGISGLDASLMPAFRAQVAASAADGSEIDSRADIQSLVTAAQELQSSMLEQISQYADNPDDPDNHPMPELETFELAGVAGVDAENLAGLNSVLAADTIAGTDVQGLDATQARVDAYNRVNESASPSQADFAQLGVDITAVLPQSDEDEQSDEAATTDGDEETYYEAGLGLFNDLIQQDAVERPISQDHIQATADFVGQLADVADATPTTNLTQGLADPQAFVDSAAAVGLIGLDDLALEPFLQRVNEDSAELTDYASLLETAQRANTQAAALREIARYAEQTQDGVADDAPVAKIFETAGVEKLVVGGGFTTDENGDVVEIEGTVNQFLHEAVTSALSTAALDGEQANSVVDLQAVVDNLKLS